MDDQNNMPDDMISETDLQPVLELLQGGDPADAARAAAPGVPRSRLSVRVRGRTVRVRIRPRTPFGLPARLLEATVVADAGPR